MEKARI